MKIRAIVTGATGMVGEGVMHECLQDPAVESVLIINRKPSGFTHPKLKEIVHGNFFDITAIENQLTGYNACYFCLGVSSVGMKEPEYRHLTYDLTMNVAKTLSRLNPDMVFCYVSGASTDSTEQGKSMWARVKGKTENDLMKLPFRGQYNFRPGLMVPFKGQKNVKIVGEETGGGSYGNTAWIIPELTLPNTRLRIGIPKFGFVMRPNLVKEGRGVLPDVYAAPTTEDVRKGIDVKMEAVRKMILEANSRL
jgi:uncharacterized protein YbjT (DUF2867 family)